VVMFNCWRKVGNSISKDLFGARKCNFQLF